MGGGYYGGGGGLGAEEEPGAGEGRLRRRAGSAEACRRSRGGRCGTMGGGLISFVARQAAEQAAQYGGAYAAGAQGIRLQGRLPSGYTIAGLDRVPRLQANLHRLRGGALVRGSSGRRVALNARTARGTELRGAARPGGSALRGAKAGGPVSALGQVGSDLLRKNNYSTREKVGRAAIAGGGSIASAAAGGAAAGLACGPGAPVCSTITAGVVGAAVAFGLQEPLSDVSDRFGLGRLDE